MIATLKYRLKPTKEQETKFHKFVGTARWVYNFALDYRIKYYSTYSESPSLQLIMGKLQVIKNSDEFSWIKETPESVTKQSIKDLFEAYSKFFKGLSRFPRFKSKKRSNFSFYQRTDKLRYWEEDSVVTLTGVGRVRLINHYGWFPDRPLNPRVKYDGKYWYLTVACEVGESNQDLTSTILGVDLGVKKLAVRSDGVEVLNINKTSRVKKLEKKLKRLQRKASRKYEKRKTIREVGESRYSKTKNTIKVEKKIRLLHRKLSNIRNNHIHNTTADIVKTKPCRVVVEDLNVKGMLKNRHLSKSVKDQCFNKFITYLKYKCEYSGIEFIKADRFFPSSKLCSCCGHKKKHLGLSERMYKCDNCGEQMDRDLNAAINLANYKVN